MSWFPLFASKKTETKKPKDKKPPVAKGRLARAGAYAASVPRKIVGGAASAVTAPFRGKPKTSASPAPSRTPEAKGTHFDRY